MNKENAHNPDSTGTSVGPSEREGVPPAPGKAAWKAPTLTVLAGEGTAWNPHFQVVGDDIAAS